jgi:signal transduction histidine kinase
VAGHRAYVRQVFDNLLSNAIKFSAKNPAPAITIGGRREGEHVRFWVSDNGPGISANQRERAFEPFVRLTPDAAGGSGIGLTIVRRIVEMYGGRIWVEPSEGPGCTISLTIPMLGELIREDERLPSAQTVERLSLPNPRTGTADDARREGPIGEEMF